MGFLWGVYCNGIAVWGRDSVLGCEEDEHRIESDACPISSIFGDDDWYGGLIEEGSLSPLRRVLSGVAHLVAGRQLGDEGQNWRNCNDE